jgi:tyrosyl-tRNA synthetase
MKIVTNSKKINEVLTRGVEAIYPNRKALGKVLRSGKKLRIYNGIDPTGELHLGHLTVLRKLRQFQDLGHEIIILIGDFTATIGDPSGKYTTRKMLTRKQVLDYAKSYKKQVEKILNFNKANVRFLHNEKWTNKLKPIDLLALASKFTVAGLLERDMFQKRIKAGQNIHVHEFLYPIFQAYDSVTMNVDLEVGGNDQTFNMLAGRTLMKKMKNKEKFVLTTKLLVDPTGKKMGKTEGNLIPLAEEPKEMYGKIMAWPDTLLKTGFELLTDLPLKEVKKIIAKPRQAKAKLAREIVTLCYSKKLALLAEKEFNKVFKEKELPSKMPVFTASKKIYPLIDLLFGAKLTSSKSEARRVISQGGVKIDGKVKKDWQEKIGLKEGQVIQIGKRKFLKIKIK